MHKEFAKDGFVALSVNLNDPKNKEDQQKSLEFLKKMNATFTNLVLDEEFEFWHKKLQTRGLPCIFVFDRDGKWVQFKEEEVNHDEIKKLVVELLKKK